MAAWALQEKKVLHSAAGSFARIAEAKADVAASLETTKVQSHMRGLMKPGSPSSAMKKAGVALIVTPDPITAVPGAALIAASYASKRNDPSSIEDLALETKKILRDIKSLSL